MRICLGSWWGERSCSVAIEKKRAELSSRNLISSNNQRIGTSVPHSLVGRGGGDEKLLERAGRYDVMEEEEEGEEDDETRKDSEFHRTRYSLRCAAALASSRSHCRIPLESRISARPKR
ncbi:uncharacterized protein [Prorops nasuta]|uniref:uncharacterized protein n=1 Tax=Prorops nasuta TaxID=863751 RepID=UPI0034CD9217